MSPLASASGKQFLRYVCDIIQTEMELEEGQVFLYNGAFVVPTASGIWVSVGVQSPKVFASKSQFVGTAENQVEEQVVNMSAILSVDIMSRDTSALERKEEVIMALGSFYSQQLQQKYGFLVGKLPTAFVNLSQIEGAAIPFRFNISPQIQYAVKKRKGVDYFDQFDHSVTEDT